MGTAIVHPQDCFLRNQSHAETVPSPPFKPNRNPNPNSIRSRLRKRSPVGFQRNINGRDRYHAQDPIVVARFRAKNMVMGQVKILKRGEDLKPERPAAAAAGNRGFGDEDLVLSSTERLGPEPETVQKQIKVSDLKVVDGLYAGSAAFLASPPPSSLPLPAFFGKKEKRNDLATSDLRRLLRLDLI